MEIQSNGEVLYIFMHMRILFLSLAVMLTTVLESVGQGNWKLKRERNGITIYVREQPDSPLKEYKARAVLERPIEQVYAFLADLKRHPEWVFRCTGITVIEVPDEQRTRYHTVYDIPWPMKDRDLIVEAVFTASEGGLKFQSLSEEINIDYPLEEGVIRMPDYREWVVLEKIDSLNTLFMAEGYADPGGKVPPWLVNMFLVDGIYDSVSKARKILQLCKK